MSLKFNADEIYEMAEQIERNGVRFYKFVAEKAADEKTRKLLLELADMEVEHEKVFAALREQLSSKDREPMAFDPDNQLGSYLQAMADGKVFDVKADPTDSLTGQESLEEVLRLALGREKDSVVFYLGMKEMVAEGSGRDKVDRIIKEELSHIGALSTELDALIS